jgi:hypothetical protein
MPICLVQQAFYRRDRLPGVVARPAVRTQSGGGRVVGHRRSAQQDAGVPAGIPHGAHGAGRRLPVSAARGADKDGYQAVGLTSDGANDSAGVLAPTDFRSKGGRVS